ncbi:MAG: hypothetical protein SGI74_10935 [Oligoflexia bacterium]|nr:hypothetical protein [Oligoflexia bacterium]
MSNSTLRQASILMGFMGELNEGGSAVGEQAAKDNESPMAYFRKSPVVNPPMMPTDESLALH